MVDDVEDEWLRPKNHYDYIHSRHMVMAVKNWPKLLKQALEYASLLPLGMLGSVLMKSKTATSNRAAGMRCRKSITTHNATTAACQ
jgi:hypothetical protein